MSGAKGSATHPSLLPQHDDGVCVFCRSSRVKGSPCWGGWTPWDANIMKTSSLLGWALPVPFPLRYPCRGKGCWQSRVLQFPITRRWRWPKATQLWAFLVVLLCPLPFGTIVINHLPPVSLGQVKEDLMSSTREAAEFPVLLDPPSSPSAANRPVLAQVEGEGLWGPSGGFPRWPHACCCSRCSARALPPRCVLACFYNKDNSTASCCFSSLSLTGGTRESPVRLLAMRPLSTKHQTQVKMSDTKKNVVWVLLAGTSSRVLWLAVGPWVYLFVSLQPFSLACKNGH